MGISKQAVIKRTVKEGWRYKDEPNPNGGGSYWTFNLEDLPKDIQRILVKKSDISGVDIHLLPPSAALIAMEKVYLFEAGSSEEKEPPKSGLSAKLLEDKRVQKYAPIIEEAKNVPPGWGSRKWIEAVAFKNDMHPATLYRRMAEFEEEGIISLKHTKSNKGGAKKWNSEALQFWFGLVMKREHRKLTLKALYEILIVEAAKNDWRIGGYDSAVLHANDYKKKHPLHVALQMGGKRALDNATPPILRTY